MISSSWTMVSRAPGFTSITRLMVVDAGRGIGNGHVIPGGPLRAPLTDQLVRTDALLKIGTANGADQLVRSAATRR